MSCAQAIRSSIISAESVKRGTAGKACPRRRAVHQASGPIIGDLENKACRSSISDPAVRLCRVRKRSIVSTGASGTGPSMRARGAWPPIAPATLSPWTLSGSRARIILRLFYTENAGPMTATDKSPSRIRLSCQALFARSASEARGTRLIIEETEDGVLLRPAPAFAETQPEAVFGVLPYKGKPKSLAEIDAGVLAEAKRCHARD